MELKALRSKMSEQKQFKPLMELTNLPEDLRISTITLTCSINTEFYVENIGKYVDMSLNAIVSTKYGKHANCSRTIVSKGNKPKRKKKNKKSFYNQVTVEVNTKSKPAKPLNVKLFKNGSIQMTGCKGFQNFVEAFAILERELKKTKAIIDPKEPNKVVEKPFMSNPENFSFENIYDLNIQMINSNFYVGFKINREMLYKILLTEKIPCNYEPCVHACVNIKYNFENKKDISVFVFESGSIIITGANARIQISEAYEFITKKLYAHYHNIVVNNIDSLLDRADVLELLAADSPVAESL
jgi:TATA-box binding protein (TBP) (component of TFIID and TFIIIB)